MSVAFPNGWIEHVVGPGERWDHLAYRYYGDAARFRPIIEANRETWTAGLVPLPTVLPVGLTLRIPMLAPQAVSEDLLPPWKRGLS